MWSRLEDELLDHPKISQAGRAIGKNGRAIALGFYVQSLLYCNRYLSDGYLSIDVVEGFSAFVLHPLAIADALATAGLFDKTDGGFRIHDFKEYNFSAGDIRRKRKADRVRKAEERAKKALARGNGAA